MLIIIEGDPVSWKAHAGYGRKSFNPLYKEKDMVQHYIKIQALDFLDGPIKVTFDFYFKMPKSTSKSRKDSMIKGVLRPVSRPDASNCIKFYEDCLKGLLFEDDSQVVEITARKWYAEKPKVVIKVERLTQE